MDNDRTEEKYGNARKFLVLREVVTSNRYRERGSYGPPAEAFRFCSL